MNKSLKIAIAAAAAVIVIGGGVVWLRSGRSAAGKVRFITESPEKGDLASTISATGTVEPEELVNVGAQVGGLITRFGTDVAKKEVDYGSKVKAGMVLAHIDDSLYTVAVREAEAEKLRSEAAILSAQANIDQSKAQLKLAELNWDRAKRLYPQQAIAKSEYDSAESAFIAAKASIAVSTAQLAVAKAQLAGAKASLDRAVRNLGYCVISSPVDGVIIDRRVSIGQTVNASMNAPSLFLIAKDLKRMQVWVSVNEADIGSIKLGMPVSFSCDTFPDREFKGTVHKIRLNATMSQNVVTYVVEVASDNSDGKLLPYLTANVKFIRAEKKNVLTISNAALRFLPEMDQVPKTYWKQLEEAASGDSRRSNERTVWVLKDNHLEPVKIVIGISDGISVEIVDGKISAGDQVVTGSELISDKKEKASVGAGGSPFLPKPPKRKKR